MATFNQIKVMVEFPALGKEYFVLTRCMEIELNSCFCCHSQIKHTRQYYVNAAGHNIVLLKIHLYGEVTSRNQ